MEQRPLDSSTLELCISSSGIAREMVQRPLDSSTLELCSSSSGIAREMVQRPLDSSTLELCSSSSGIAREMERRPLDSAKINLQIRPPPPLPLPSQCQQWNQEVLEYLAAQPIEEPSRQTAEHLLNQLDGYLASFRPDHLSTLQELSNTLPEKPFKKTLVKTEQK